ncbi:hypothetical protein ACM26V_14725 [Salipaludibacillus sp. HK11]|uniref:hypothetical protein n=1 Tax=Salipaludibacillus sp. HK11 TaxID=3394320 RepID=UPI0039FD1302
MENPIWLFVIAAYIAVIGIFIAYKPIVASFEKRVLDKERVTQDNFQKEVTRFFIKVPIIEIVPIFLVIFGFIQLDEVQGTGQFSDVVVPFALVMVVLLFTIVKVISMRGRIASISDIDNQSKNYINTLTFISISLLSALPIISIVAMILFVS